MIHTIGLPTLCGFLDSHWVVPQVDRRGPMSTEPLRERARHRCFPAAPSPPPSYPTIHHFSLICLREPFAQLPLLPAAVCQDVPGACDSGRAPASPALHSPIESRAGLTELKSPCRDYCSQSLPDILFHTNSLLPPNTCPLPKVQAFAKQRWCAGPHARGSLSIVPQACLPVSSVVTST